MPAIETQPAKRLAPLPWAPAHGATGILPVVGPLLRRHVVFARAGSPRHQEGWCLGGRSVRVALTQLSTRRRAPAGVPATSDVGNTRDGCRASAGRRSGRRPGRFSFSGARLPHARNGEPPWRPPGELRHSHQAGRRDARRWPRSSEDERSPHATAGRRAGAEARPAPNATAGRWTGEPDPGALLPSEVFRNTGLLSHSAAPLLQLASLRRPGSRLPIDRQRSPPVVSTAFLVPGTRFSVTRYPRIATRRPSRRPEVAGIARG
jgi:hypothetical protein